MVGFAGMKKILLFSAVAGLVVACAVVSAAEGGEAAVETQPEKKKRAQLDDGGDSKATGVAKDVNELLQSVVSETSKQEGNAIDQLLSQSSKTNDQLDAAASKQKILNLTSYGLGALAGLGGLASLVGVAYGRKKGQPPSGRATAVGSVAALATILGVTGAALAHWQKRKAEEKAKSYARDLLAQRQAMLSKLHDVDDLEEVLEKTNDIAAVADDMGMYVPDISDAVTLPAGQEKAGDN